jgi:FkbM family methyltransferase
MIKEQYYGENINELLQFFNCDVKGVLHVGAHKCEELSTYNKYTNNIVWIEAIKSLVEENLQLNPDLNIINEVIGDIDGKEIEFKITNNVFSSSILDLKYHKKIHPDIFVTSTYKTKTKSLKTIYKEYNLKSDLNLLVLDLQGVELLALTGLGDLINDFNYIYTEINEEEIYEDCCKLNDIDSYLTKYGFEKKYLMVLNGYGNAFYIKR